MTCSTTSFDSAARWAGRFIGAACLITASIVAVPAYAEPSAAERAIARSLFEQGRELMNAKRYAEACPKFEESQRLMPAGGTLLNLAVCHEQIGRTATAWAEFNEVATLSRQENKADREQFAREHLASLSPRLSRLTVTVPAQTAARQGLVIKLDSAVLGKTTWGTALPIDPGDHVLEVSAPGLKTWSTKVSVGPDADKASVAVPASLEELSVAADSTKDSAAPGSARPAAKNVAPEPDSAPSKSAGSTQRTLALVAGGVGVAGLAVGTVFGLRARSKESESESYCRPDNPSICSQQGVDLIDEGRTSATLSNAGFIVGGVGIVASAVLWLTAPAPKAATVGAGGLAVAPGLGPSNATLLVRGSF